MGRFRRPQYHTQFIAISGIVEFKSADAASYLPPLQSAVSMPPQRYITDQEQDERRYADFTDFTNKWKGKEEEAKALIQQGERLSFDK